MNFDLFCFESHVMGALLRYPEWKEYVTANLFTIPDYKKMYANLQDNPVDTSIKSGVDMYTVLTLWKETITIKDVFVFWVAVLRDETERKILRNFLRIAIEDLDDGQDIESVATRVSDYTRKMYLVPY